MVSHIPRPTPVFALGFALTLTRVEEQWESLPTHGFRALLSTQAEVQKRSRPGNEAIQHFSLGFESGSV